MTFIKLEKILFHSVKKAGIKNQLDSSDFMNQLKEAGEIIFGAENIKKMKFLECKDGVLHIACTSSILADKLKAREKSLVWQLNKSFGKKVVEKLKFLN